MQSNEDLLQAVIQLHVRAHSKQVPPRALLQNYRAELTKSMEGHCNPSTQEEVGRSLRAHGHPCHLRCCLKEKK